MQCNETRPRRIQSWKGIQLCKAILLPALCVVSGGAGSGTTSVGRGITERVDLIELNHFYDDQDRHNYDQIIFYEWSYDYCRFHVIAWCLIEKDHSRMPRRDPGGDYVVRWFDRDAKINREVRTKLFRETWGQVDPERANKRVLDEKYRVSLVRVKRPAVR